jgi:hypothetical protein
MMLLPEGLLEFDIRPGLAPGRGRSLAGALKGCVALPRENDERDEGRHRQPWSGMIGAP